MPNLYFVNIDNCHVGTYGIIYPCVKFSPSQQSNFLEHNTLPVRDGVFELSEDDFILQTATHPEFMGEIKNIYFNRNFIEDYLVIQDSHLIFYSPNKELIASILFFVWLHLIIRMESVGSIISR